MEDRIELYVKGRLSDAERRAFEQELAADAELREAVELARLAREAAWSHHQLELRQTALQALRRERTRPYRRLAVAGVVALLLVLAWLLIRRGSDAAPPAPTTPAPSGPIADRYYQRPETDAYLATAADENERQFNLARQAFEAQNCAEAQPMLEKLAATANFKYRTASRLLLAACQYEQPGQLPRAIANFQAIVASGPADDFTVQQAQWYLALARLKNAESAAARALLEDIAAQPGHAYAAQARALLGELGK